MAAFAEKTIQELRNVFVLPAIAAKTAIYLSAMVTVVTKENAR